MSAQIPTLLDSNDRNALSKARSSIVMYKQRPSGADKSKDTTPNNNGSPARFSNGQPVFSKQPTSLSNDNSSISGLNADKGVSIDQTAESGKIGNSNQIFFPSNSKKEGAGGFKPILKARGGKSSTKDGGLRIDTLGNPITAGGKRHKITLNENSNQVHHVESLKKYNSSEYDNQTSCSCSIMQIKISRPESSYV
eukprot:TRINITY_DN1212_c0_g5_i1.p1 TRINITY_DN1212_c0_g5~~TRINITY_DN1212_c0_g5_i1.p1  ORF type:complete len:195 (+),score=29.70 TRINITY_DN1212_c0_g5_i1:121-705(+)